MKKIFKKVNLLLSVIFISSVIGGNVSYASGSSIIKNESPILINETNNNSGNIIGNQGGSSSGSLSKAEEYVETKLFDVVGFFQSFIKPLTYLTFIISVIMVLFGVITDSRSKFAGFMGMAFSVFVYVAVVFAPQIVDYFGAWLSM